MEDIVLDYFVLIRIPNHPRAVGDGYVPQQVLVMEQHLGRYLTDDEDVKHLNNNPHDNRIDNLQLVTSNLQHRALSLFDDSKATRAATKTFVPCKFQTQCWKTIRAPIARKHKVYLPYICSYQSEGDVYKCSHFWNFKQGERRQENNDPDIQA